MGGEKNFENRLKKWLESEGVYPLGEPVDKMKAPPCGYYEKRWGGGRYVKAGLPDMRIVVNGIALQAFNIRYHHLLLWNIETKLVHKVEM